jgi:sterol desaturase/sphingolipid hydroxylase (fatty acid hydroxylase superfamily)
MNESIAPLLLYKTLAIGGWVLVLLVLERALPCVVRPDGNQRIGRNIGLWLINSALSPLIVVPVSLWAATSALAWRPDWLGGWGGLVLDVLVLDGLIYWWHRANHQIPLLWRFHQVHHLDNFLDLTSAVRFHFGEVLLSAGFRAVVIIALGIPLISVLVFEVLVLAAAAFHHSNLRLGSGFETRLSRLVVTPSIHWVHHHALRADTDSNYATIFSLWDRLFTSSSATPRTPEMPIGVEGRDDESFLKLLAKPLKD